MLPGRTPAGFIDGLQRQAGLAAQVTRPHHVERLLEEVLLQEDRKDVSLGRSTDVELRNSGWFISRMPPGRTSAGVLNGFRRRRAPVIQATLPHCMERLLEGVRLEEDREDVSLRRSRDLELWSNAWFVRGDPLFGIRIIMWRSRTRGRVLQDKEGESVMDRRRKLSSSEGVVSGHQLVLVMDNEAREDKRVTDLLRGVRGRPVIVASDFGGWGRSQPGRTAGDEDS
nr:uncharacterized protein LOC129163691 [Nothobranchius furzeri]